MHTFIAALLFSGQKGKQFKYNQQTYEHIRCILHIKDYNSLIKNSITHTTTCMNLENMSTQCGGTGLVSPALERLKEAMQLAARTTLQHPNPKKQANKARDHTTTKEQTQSNKQIFKQANIQLHLRRLSSSGTSAEQTEGGFLTAASRRSGHEHMTK